VVFTTLLLYRLRVTSREFKRWLQRRGCKFEPGKGGHLLVRHGQLRSVLPVHGSRQDLPKGTVEAIKKDLGLNKEH
jgi:mRNA interferase HicA